MNGPKASSSRWRKVLWTLLGVLLITLAAVAGRCLYAFRDRNPGYTLALNLDGSNASGQRLPLRVGFAQVKINPNLTDPAHPIWLAGFSQNRAATALHDDLWAVACVITDGSSRLGIVALDAIGLFHDDVIRIRRSVPDSLHLDYTVVCTTHNHSTPDLMGLWGPNFLRTGVDGKYLQEVRAATVQAIAEAATNLQPAQVAFHQIPVPNAGLVADTRKPELFDPDLRVMHFTRPADGTTLGTVVTWANHPETVWGRNTEITADFPGYLREALANGVHENNRRLEAGLGGIHLYLNGAIGGLLSTTPSVTVRDPYLQQDFRQPSHEKARAVGRQLASRLLSQLRQPEPGATNRAALTIRARTLELPLDNLAFLVAPALGLLDRGHVRWQTLRTEVALITFGEASIACIPGEIYPELVNGGIEKAPGGDFQVDPVEIPPIRDLLPGRVRFVFGLANDEIGYIIPKSEWDRKPPYLYGAHHPVYGEINSVGPETAGHIHALLRQLAAGLN